jgi:hypothetical protein
MKKNFLLCFMLLFNTLFAETILEKHIILPREFHIGQEFIYEGIPYIIKGYEQKKSNFYEKVKLILEHPIELGLEFGTETIILKIKHGKDKNNEITYDTSLRKRIRSYNWKAYLFGYLLIRYFIPPLISVK